MASRWSILLLAASLFGQQARIANEVSQSGTYASAPTSCSPGALYVPTDSLYNFLRCPSTGAPWQHVYAGLDVTPPALSDFAWINQGTSTTSTAYGGVQLTVPATSGYDLHILKKSAPATPYTVTAFISPLLINSDSRMAGLLFRESSTGRLHVCTVISMNLSPTGWYAESSKFTNVTTFSAAYQQNTITWLHPLFLRIQDTGVNRTCSFSYDGVNFLTIHSVARADFLTADEIGVFGNAAHATYGGTTNWLHWKIE